MWHFVYIIPTLVADVNSAVSMLYFLACEMLRVITVTEIRMLLFK